MVIARRILRRMVILQLDIFKFCERELPATRGRVGDALGVSFLRVAGNSSFERNYRMGRKGLFGGGQ